jgi:hypothetical protein
MAPFNILFETDRFNVSTVKEHFINPCCFGEDLAEWLRQELIKKGITTSTPGQEDWGWYLFVEQRSARYFVGFTGFHRAGALEANDGEWRIMVETRRTVWEWLRGRNRITPTNPFVLLIEDLLHEQGDVRNVTREML